MIHQIRLILESSCGHCPSCQTIVNAKAGDWHAYALTEDGPAMPVCGACVDDRVRIALSILNYRAEIPAPGRTATEVPF